MNGERRVVYGILAGKSEGKRSSGRPRRGWDVNFEWIFRKRDARVWNVLIWLRTGIDGRHL
jgi:hypothetical protein